jgi:ATP-binding cassette subfamily B protein
MADRPPGRQGSPSSLPSHGPAGKGRTRIEKARDPRSALRRLLAYLHPYRGQLVVVFGLVVVSSLLDLMGPYLIGVAIDGAIAGGDPDGLLRILLLMLGVYVLLWLIQLGQGGPAGDARPAARPL